MHGTTVRQTVIEVLKATDLQKCETLITSTFMVKKINKLCSCRVFCHVTKICKQQQLYIRMYVFVMSELSLHVGTLCAVITRTVCLPE